MGMDVFGKKPSKPCGQYFRATVWSWPPLHLQMAQLCGDLLSGKLLSAMACNDGAGPDDQETCTSIAERLALAVGPEENGTPAGSAPLWVVDATGRVVDGDSLPELERCGNAIRFSIGRERVFRWIEFLRHCGGFAVF